MTPSPNKHKEVTCKLMQLAREGPQAIGMVLKDTQNPMDDECNVIWRHVTSNKEKLLGLKQQHADWTCTSEEKKAIYYCKIITGEEGRTDKVQIIQS